MNQPNSVCSVIFSPRVIASVGSVDIVTEFVLHGDISDNAPFCRVPYDVPFAGLLTFTTAESKLACIQLAVSRAFLTLSL
jgi:hypothetical protein